MKVEHRKVNGLLAVVVDDPWRKLLAIVLAVMLWFFITAQVVSSDRRTIPLLTVGTQSVPGLTSDRLAVVLPTDQVVGLRFLDGERVIDKIDVVVSGPSFRVAAIKTEPLDLQVTAFLGRDWGASTSASTTVEFTAADVRRDQRVLQDLTIQLDPPRVRLEVAAIAQRTYPLTLETVELQEGALEGRLRRETAEFTPPSATVLGRAIGIEQFTKRGGKMFRATMQGSGNEPRVSVQLELIGGDELGLRFAAKPLLTMQVLPQTQRFDLEVPILVDDLALPPEQRGLYQADPKTRRVAFHAGGQLRSTLVSLDNSPDKTPLQEWAMANLRLYVNIPKLAPGDSYGPEIDRSPRLRVVGRLEDVVDRRECTLAESVSIKLRRTQ